MLIVLFLWETFVEQSHLNRSHHFLVDICDVVWGCIICCVLDGLLPVVVSGCSLSNYLVFEMIEFLLFCASKVAERIIVISFQD